MGNFFPDAFLNISHPETNTKRQATQHGCRPSLVGDGGKGIEIVYGEGKKIFCTGLTRASKTEQKSLVPARQAQRTNQRRTNFICTLWVSIHLSFNSQQGPPLSSLSVHNTSPPPPLSHLTLFKHSSLRKLPPPPHSLTYCFSFFTIPSHILLSNRCLSRTFCAMFWPLSALWWPGLCSVTCWFDPPPLWLEG